MKNTTWTPLKPVVILQCSEEFRTALCGGSFSNPTNTTKHYENISQIDITSLIGLPLWQLTAGQFLSLVRTALPNADAPPATTTVVDHSDGSRYAFGIKGICEIFGCSKPTAQRMKSSGMLDGAISQSGRTIVIDRAKALELVMTADKKRKGGRK